MKKKKFRKTRLGKGWSKEHNMSRNAVAAMNSGFVTWDDYDKTYFTGTELNHLHFYVSHVYVRHHLGNNKKEIYMFPKNVLDLIGSDDSSWTYFKEDYPIEYNAIEDMKKNVEKRKQIISELLKILHDTDDNTTDEEVDKIITSYVKKILKTTDMSFNHKDLAEVWCENLILKVMEVKQIDENKTQ